MTAKKIGRPRKIPDGKEGPIIARIAEGETIPAIARSLKVGNSTLERFLTATPERDALFRAARQVSAEASVDKAERVLEEAAESPTLDAARASIARARSEHHRWLAAVRNRATYGEPNRADINLNLNLVGSLHMDALRAKGSMDLAPPGAVKELGPVVDAELIEEDNNVAGLFND